MKKMHSQPNIGFLAAGIRENPRITWARKELKKKYEILCRQKP